MKRLLFIIILTVFVLIGGLQSMAVGKPYLALYIFLIGLGALVLVKYGDWYTKRLRNMSIVVLVVSLASCNHTYERDDTGFYNGEVLLPDYVHKDTLIVVNADSLNWAIKYYDIASDGDIYEILHEYTVTYPANIIERYAFRRGYENIVFVEGKDTLALEGVDRIK